MRGWGLDHRSPAPRVAHTHTHHYTELLQCTQSLTNTDPPTQSHRGRGAQEQQAAREEATHTHKTPVIHSQENINHKHAVPARFGDRVQMKIILLTRIMSPDLPRSGQVSTVNRL